MGRRGSLDALKRNISSLVLEGEPRLAPSCHTVLRSFKAIGSPAGQWLMSIWQLARETKSFPLRCRSCAM